MAEAAAAQTTETSGQQTTQQTEQQQGQQTEQKTEQKAEEQSTETSLLGADEEKTEQKTEGEKKPEGEAPKIFDAEKLQLPEGFQKDDKVFPKFIEIMSNEKLSPQERGQNLMNLYAEAVEGAVKQVSEANTNAWNDTKTKWEGEIKADPEYGGEKVEPTKQMIMRVLTAKVGAESTRLFKQALNVTGAGSNPALFRVLAKVLAPLDEGTHVAGGPGKGKPGITDTFFPNSPDMKDS